MNIPKLTSNSAHSPLLKYKIGLSAIGIFTIVIVGVVIAQASNNKQDTATYNDANNIANQINNYVDNYGVAPASLKDAGILNVPKTITYTYYQNSGDYKFCIDYKTSSSDFSALSVESGSVFDDPNDGNSVDPGDAASQGVLIIDTSHKSGENCQTVGSTLNANSIKNDVITGTD